MKRAIVALVLAAFVVPAVTVLADDDEGYTVDEYRTQRVNIQNWHEKKQDKNAAKRERLEAKLAESEAELADVEAAIADPLTPTEALPGLLKDKAKVQRKIDKLAWKLGDKLAAKEAKKSTTLERQYDKKLQQLRERAETAGIDWAAEDASLFP